ncbi:MAG: hypothetical protein JWM31_742 [Solirubrobacterales bacterium]|nr:hypothetical protein [Solirubrobacterales bacterium]
MLTAGAAGCGDSGDEGGTTTTGGVTSISATGPGTSLTAPFTFAADGLTPSSLTVKAPDGRLTLRIISADGRPHGVSIVGLGVDRRLLVQPGRRADLDLTGLAAGRYRVVPDGATEPVTLKVE